MTKKYFSKRKTQKMNCRQNQHFEKLNTKTTTTFDEYHHRHYYTEMESTRRKPKRHILTKPLPPLNVEMLDKTSNQEKYKLAIRCRDLLRDPKKKVPFNTHIQVALFDTNDR